MLAINGKHKKIIFLIYIVCCVVFLFYNIALAIYQNNHGGVAMHSTAGGGGSPTYFGESVSPTDPGSDITTPRTITPPASMQQYDLVVVVATYRGACDITNSTTGGQSWTAATEYQTASHVVQVFHCTFDGTWDESPAFANDAGVNSFNIQMLVFRPASTPHTWAVDQAFAGSDYTAPDSPYDVTISGITTGQDNAVVIFMWEADDDVEWSLQTGGWSNPGSITQVRNTGGSDHSSSVAYLIKTSAGATGDATNRQGTNGPDGGAIATISLY